MPTTSQTTYRFSLVKTWILTRQTPPFSARRRGTSTRLAQARQFSWKAASSVSGSSSRSRTSADVSTGNARLRGCGL